MECFDFYEPEFRHKMTLKEEENNDVQHKRINEQ
jgi:hypothetical protein